MLGLEKGVFFGDIRRYCQGDNITSCITNYEKGDWSANLKHFHHHPNIFYIVQGSVRQTWSNCTSEKRAGSLCYYPAGAPHQNERKTFPSQSLNIEIELDLLNYYDLTEAVVEAAISRNPMSSFLMLQIYQELIANDSLTSTSVKIQLLHLISQSEKLINFKVWPQWLKNLDALLHDRWYENLSLEELSNAVGVHPITISKYFSRYFNCTLGQYLRKLKVQHSLILINQNVNLTEVAFQCGFADQSHFIRNFKKYTGLLPSQYRKIFVTGKICSI
ncbi:MAG: AraC family transcriptional regulator [Saprospiraceae bacterium]|nr:AraC family transcriptional regulator [Saprospiraceae bacterium]